MPDFHFSLKLGSHLSLDELNRAAELLSEAYTRWQNNPKNTAPMGTDTSPEVYARMLASNQREVILYHEAGSLRGVFVHSMSPLYDQYPLRKLSYLAMFPRERGFENLKQAFVRYSAFVAGLGEDVIVTSDLDQATLNALLESAGFREITDRNETYYLLSQLLFRKVFKAARVADDFVVDEIIVCDGKAIRRDKKLLRLQTSEMDFYEVYRKQQYNRLLRAVPERNFELLAQAMRHSHEGVFFISDFTSTITRPPETNRVNDLKQFLFGEARGGSIEDYIAPEEKCIYLLPESEQELAAMARATELRAGFFDFLCYCYKILGSFFVATGVTPFEARAALDRPLHDKVSLRYLDMMEGLLTPDVEILPHRTRMFPDGHKRTAFRYSGPYIDLSRGRFELRKDRMIADILALRRADKAPVIYIGMQVVEGLELHKLWEESRARCMPTLVLDLGGAISDWVGEAILRKQERENPYFSVVPIRDFYQVPVMLEYLGLQTEQDIELRFSG